MRLGQLAFLVVVIQLMLSLAWRVSAMPISQRGSERAGLSPSVSILRRALLDPAANIQRTRRAKTAMKAANVSVSIVDAKGNDVWDGEITNEDMRGILNDRFGLLAVTLGVLAMVLLFLVILTLGLAYSLERSQERAYRELYDQK